MAHVGHAVAAGGLAEERYEVASPIGRRAAPHALAQRVVASLTALEHDRRGVGHSEPRHTLRSEVEAPRRLVAETDEGLLRARCRLPCTCGTAERAQRQCARGDSRG